MPTYELLAAYCSADYRVELPNRNFSIRLGNLSPEIDDLLAETGKSTWAIITAENPRSRQLSESENAERRELLRQRMSEGGDWQVFPAIAVCPRSEWPPEHGQLVVGIAEDEALSLARTFGQYAVVWGRSRGWASLRLTEPENWRVTLNAGLEAGEDLVRKVCGDLIVALQKSL